MTETDDAPWYRYFWPWFLIAVPASAVLAGAVTLWLALSDPSGLVVDDYYKAGLAINRVIARDRRARELGAQARLTVAPELPGPVTLVINTNGRRDYPYLQLRWLHPTRSGFDQSVRLRSNGDGRFSGYVEEMPPGDWHLQLVPPDETWRLVGRTRMPGSTGVELRPAPTP